MALNLAGKKAIVKEVGTVLNQALSVVIADSCGVSVSAMTALRKQAKDNQISMRVVRNTLARRAFEGSSYEYLSDHFKGPTLIAFSLEHPGAAARLLKQFAKEEQAFEIKAAGFEGELITAEQIDRLALLPTYDEAIARLMSVMKNASAGKLVRTLAALHGKLEQEAA